MQTDSLLTEPVIMLAALKESDVAPSVPADCIRRLLMNLRLASIQQAPDMERVRKSVYRAYRNLCIAGLLDPDEFGRCTLTSRGRQVLQDYPLGVDDSVLEQFPEYLRYTRSYNPEGETGRTVRHVVEPKPEYLEGIWAFHAGDALADNPCSTDTVAHLEWKNGWSSASGV